MEITFSEALTPNFALENFDVSQNHNALIINIIFFDYIKICPNA